MLHLIYTLIIGFIAGLIARAIKPGDDNMGIILTTVLGVAGALIATYGGRALHIYPAGQVAGFIAAVIGAIILLFVVHFIHRMVKK